MVLDTYKVVDGVPVYIRPLDLYGRIKDVPVASLRGEFRCFISENAKWKSRLKGLVHGEREAADYRVDLVKVIVMGRAKTPEGKVLAERALSSMGLKLNPYGHASSVCFGFYLDSFDMLDGVVRGIRGWVDALAIVNTVWYVRYGRMVNLRRLVEAGFTPRGDAFKVAAGVVNNSILRVFHNGTVGVHSPHTEATVRVLAEQVYSLFRKLGALV